MTHAPFALAFLALFLPPRPQGASARYPVEVDPAGALDSVSRGETHFTAAWHAGRRRALSDAVAQGSAARGARSQGDAAEARGGPGVIVLRGAPARRDYQRFRQTNEFFYLTGVDAPGAALVIHVKSGKEVLFLAPMEPGEGIWLDVRPHAPARRPIPQDGEDGADAIAEPEKQTPKPKRLKPSDVQEQGEALAAALGFADVRETTELRDYLQSVRDEGPFYTMLAPEEYEATSRDEASSYERAQERDAYDGRPSRTQQFKAKLAELHGVEVKDLTPFFDRLRRIKTPEEIEAIRRASRIAAAGHLAAMRATRPGIAEWQIGAEATAAFYRMGAPAISYFPIVGTGRNAIILHYTDTGATVGADDVILMDYAPEWRFYASDVTRSWPASGKFNATARKIYAAVLKAQEAAIAAVKPGVNFGVVNRAALESLQADGFAPMQYMPHGLSHPIGMSTHDVGGLGRLEPGLVFTIEPGIYDRASGIGVRIEDVIAVTGSGADVLSRDCPKSIEEIEAVVGRRLP